MFAADVDYHRAGSVAEAVRLLQQNDGAKLIAGGHSLIPLMKLRLAAPTALVDIGRIDDLKGIEISNGAARIGPLTTHAEIAASDALAAACPILAQAAGMIGDPQVRKPGHHRRQCGPRGSGVRLAGRPHGLGRHIQRNRT